MNSPTWKGDRARGGEGDAQRQRDDQRNDDVAALGQIHAVLDEVAHADGGDHAVENQGNAADGAGRHSGNERRELRAEGRDDRVDGGQTDDQRIIHAVSAKNAGVLAVVVSPARRRGTRCSWRDRRPAGCDADPDRR